MKKKFLDSGEISKGPISKSLGLIVLTYAPSRYVCHIAYVSTTALLLQSTYKLHITAYLSKTNNPLSSGLSSNMYYAFGNHIYSLSPMTTYTFLILQTYFVFCIYGRNFGKCRNVYNSMKAYTDSLKHSLF